MNGFAVDYPPRLQHSSPDRQAEEISQDNRQLLLWGRKAGRCVFIQVCNNISEFWLDTTGNWILIMWHPTQRPAGSAGVLTIFLCSRAFARSVIQCSVRVFVWIVTQIYTLQSNMKRQHSHTTLCMFFKDHPSFLQSQSLLPCLGDGPSLFKSRLFKGNLLPLIYCQEQALLTPQKEIFVLFIPISCQTFCSKSLLGGLFVWWG